MTDIEILDLAQDFRHVDNATGYEPHETFDALGFARAIERALNQRLAVKEGEAVAVGIDESVDGVYVTVRQGDTIVYSQMHRQVTQDERDNMIVQCCDGGETRIKDCRDCGQWAYYPATHTHPVSDDQQAKDAARYRWLREYPNNLHMDIYGDDGIGGRMVKRNNFLDEAIDAALSTTNQEEA